MSLSGKVFCAGLAVCLLVADGARAEKAPGPIVVADFESQTPGLHPSGWKYLHERRLVPFGPRFNRPAERFLIARDGDDNTFVRSHTAGEAIRIILPNGDGYRWRLGSHPRLQWRWRAHVLPEGAREDRRGPNDTGAALYVTLSRDWLGRPRTIKYTYSSTLPVGSTASYGTLKVLVASSARDGVGRWQTVARDVVEDYRALFGGTPASEPVAIALWNDSDSTQLAAESDFDDILLLPPGR